jgi:hypothetical protein
VPTRGLTQVNRARGYWRRILLDLISMSFEFSESTVLVALGLGIIVAIGLIIREKVQGSERGISR